MTVLKSNLGCLKYLILGRQAAGNGSDELGSNDELLGDSVWAGLNTKFGQAGQQEMEVVKW